MPELSIVMPVYNEAGALRGVIDEWVAMLGREAIDYELRIYDDGSRDATADVLRAAAASNPRIVATTKPNSGHGPTILRGYAEARGTWIFQTDSDGEMEAASFPKLWAARGDHDFLLGERVGRVSSAHRRILTSGSRAVVAIFFGRAVTDVNSPYRLMRADWLRRQLERIPADAAVPNILLSGLAAKTRARIFTTPVPHLARRTGTTSLNVRRIARLAMRAIADAAKVAIRRPR